MNQKTEQGENDSCPNAANHTKSPLGYLAWHEWAEKMSRRYKQVVCDGCGRYSIWVARDEDEPDWGGRIEDYGITEAEWEERHGHYVGQQ